MNEAHTMTWQQAVVALGVCFTACFFIWTLFGSHRDRD